MIEMILLKEMISIKTSASKECDMFQNWCFLEKRFNFQLYVCNWCHDILVVSVKLIDIAILKIRGVNYNYIIKRISQSAKVN